VKSIEIILAFGKFPLSKAIFDLVLEISMVITGKLDTFNFHENEQNE